PVRTEESTWGVQTAPLALVAETGVGLAILLGQQFPLGLEPVLLVKAAPTAALHPLLVGSLGDALAEAGVVDGLGDLLRRDARAAAAHHAAETALRSSHPRHIRSLLDSFTL